MSGHEEGVPFVSACPGSVDIRLQSRICIHHSFIQVEMSDSFPCGGEDMSPPLQSQSVPVDGHQPLSPF